MPQLAQKAAQSRARVARALELLEVPRHLAWDVARRLPYKLADEFTKELERLFHGHQP